MTPDQYRREGFQAGIEAAARITEGGYCCRSCGQVFLNDNGHSDADCSQGYADWETATDFQKATAIRAIAVDEVLTGLPEAPDAVARLVEAKKDKACRRLISGFMLDCNAIGYIAAAENLVRGIKEYVALAQKGGEA